MDILNFLSNAVTSLNFWAEVAVISFTILIVHKFLSNQKPLELPPVTPEMYDSEMNKLDKVVTAWIQEENARNDILISSRGYSSTFLGQLATINFKSVGINPLTDSTLNVISTDTEERRSYSNFLDLVCRLHITIDPIILETFRQRYTQSFEALINTPYAHTKKQIDSIFEHYPWLALLDYIANHPLVVSQTVRMTSIVDTDNSQAMRTNVLASTEQPL